eukprot:scaffold533_cov369-Prasinococcus_capsulatus_cf.AAC.16
MGSTGKPGRSTHSRCTEQQATGPTRPQPQSPRQQHVQCTCKWSHSQEEQGMLWRTRRHTALNEGRHEHVQRRAQVVGLTDCVRCGCHLLLCCCAVAASVQYRSSCKGCQGALQRGADSQVSH